MSHRHHFRNGFFFVEPASRFGTAFTSSFDGTGTGGGFVCTSSFDGTGTHC